MVIVDVLLDYPDPALLPNKKSQHRWIKDIRNAEKLKAKVAAAQQITRAPLFKNRDAFVVTLYMYPPDKRHRDIDNFLASMKPAIDGVFMALNADDAKIQQVHVYKCKPDETRGGYVRVVVANVIFADPA